jgi:cell division protein FtsB
VIAARLPWSTLVLIALLALVQAQLWLGSSGKPHAMNLQLQLERQQAANVAARARNDQLAAEVRDLREGLEMVEERARAAWSSPTRSWSRSLQHLADYLPCLGSSRCWRRPSPCSAAR